MVCAFNRYKISEINLNLESKIKTKNVGPNLKLEFSEVVLTTSD